MLLLEKFPVPIALAYWIDHPFSETLDEPRLYNSMYLVLYVAPVFPPPV